MVPKFSEVNIISVFKFMFRNRLFHLIRRAKELALKNIMFIGMGISGGEEGARIGPSLMPGGPQEAYDLIQPILIKCAAQTPSGPCVSYLGPIGTGNYVKMVHNGYVYFVIMLVSFCVEYVVI